MSDRPLWTRDSEVALQCNEPVVRVVMSPDDVYLACLTRGRDTVVVTHRETADTVAVLRGLPVVDLAWSGIDHLVVLRESSVAYSLLVHELPDGGEVTAHIIARTAAHAPTLRTETNTHTAVLVDAGGDDRDDEAFRRLTVFSGARAEVRRAVRLHGLSASAPFEHPRVRAAALHPDGASLMLLMRRASGTSWFIFASLLDGSASEYGYTVPEGEVSLDWSSGSRVLLRGPSPRSRIYVRIGVPSWGCSARDLAGQVVVGSDLHPDGAQVLVVATSTAEPRTETRIETVSVDDTRAEPTLWWRGPTQTLHAMWDHHGAILVASSSGGLLTFSRLRHALEQPEWVCSLERPTVDPSTLRLRSSPSRRHALVTEVSRAEGVEVELRRVSLITV